MSEKMRDEFHEWCDSIGFTLKMNAWGNYYAIGYGFEQWQVWQASRAALVVELPAQSDLSAITFLDSPIMDAEEVKASLDAAGVGYK